MMSNVRNQRLVCLGATLLVVGLLITLFAPLATPILLAKQESGAPAPSDEHQVTCSTQSHDHAHGEEPISSCIPGPAEVTTTNNNPTLLASYVIRPYPIYAQTRYSPRSFSSSPYRGWDVLTLPGRYVNDGINTTLSNSDWLTLKLNRAATLVVVWRGQLAPPNWLSGWPRGSDVVIGNSTYRTYRQNFSAGTVTLGAVNNPGVSTSQPTYLVLLAESNGSPSQAPSVPAGRETPQINRPCPAWVHDQYVATGPDGNTYPTWHPQIDPVYWCYFQHEHGSDPSLFSANYKPVYGYTMAEGHAGFKNYIFDDGAGYRWLITHHFGTAGLVRACARFHTTDVAVKNLATGEIVADLHLMGDYGISMINRSEEVLTPPNCPNQAREAANSFGVRKLPAANRDAVGYEPWRLDASGNILGFNAGALTFNTPGAIDICNNATCDQPVATGNKGDFRFFSFVQGFGIRAGQNTGVFYTDAEGKRLMSAGQSGALRQYVKPGLSISISSYNGDAFYASEPWQVFYRPMRNPGPSSSDMNLEGALSSPN